MKNRIFHYLLLLTILSIVLSLTNFLINEYHLYKNQSLCQKIYGNHISYNQNVNQCQCTTGFAPDEGDPFQCIPIKQYCEDEYGIGAVNKVDEYIDDMYPSDTCICKNGYEWSSDGTECINITKT